MDQPTTSTVEKEGQKLELENIGSETTTMLNRIIWKLKLDQKSTIQIKNIPISDPIARTARYTGMNTANVEKLLASGGSEKFDRIQIDRQIIQKELMSMYLDHNHIPTITEFFQSLQDKLPIHVNLEYFTKILIKMGYVFYKFPKRKSLRVMEKKTVMFERYKYLKTIQQYRKDEVPIVYIGIATLNNSMDLLNLEETLEAGAEHIFCHFFFTATNEGVENVEVCPSASYEVLKNAIKHWLVKLFVLQDLPPGRVCVLEDSKIFRDTLIDVPTWKSMRADMMEWLEEHNIPCHDKMSKADLLELVDTCTDTKKNTFVIDNLFKTYKYTLLRLPQCINGLSIIPFIIRFINNNQYYKNVQNRVNPGLVLSNVFKDLIIFSKAVEFEEKKQLDEDVKLDNALDELVRKMKMLEIDEEDNEDDVVFPNFSDSD